MVQIVCIDTGTKRPNNEIGDIVDILDHDIDVSEGVYSTFKIISVNGISKAEIKQRLVAETDNRDSKYSHNVGLSKSDIDNLKNPIVNKQSRITILQKITANN